MHTLVVTVLTLAYVFITFLVFTIGGGLYLEWLYEDATNYWGWFIILSLVVVAIFAEYGDF